jgi:hypothetical protein
MTASVRLAALFALLSLMAASQLPAQEEAPVREQKAAVLKLREVNFLYRSSVAPLSCSAIQGRVASILLTLGARQDIEVGVSGCDAVIVPEEPTDTWQMPSRRGQVSSDPWQTSADPSQSSSARFHNRSARREQSAHVRVRAMMPIEVTPEVLNEVQKDKSRRELVSRVTGNPAAGLNDPIVFPAQRQLITLSHHTVGLAPEDCELLEQMSLNLFSRLDIRVVRRGTGCDRDRVSHIPPQVTVEALMPVMPTTPKLAPESGGSEPDPSAPAAAETKSSEPATVAQPE